MAQSARSTRRNILWVIPVFQSVYPKPFGQFLCQALSAHRVADRYAFSCYVPERKILHGAMNEAAQLLLHHDFAAMIVSDDDCLPPIDAIERLLVHFEHGHDVVAGLGFMRNYPHTTTVGRYYPEGTSIVLRGGKPELNGFEWVEDVAAEPADLIKADFCGFPIAMISRRAFEKIEAPWFGTHINGGGCTHDVYFGVKAKAAKIDILVDRTIECGHLAEAPVLTVQSRLAVRDVQRKFDAEVARVKSEKQSGGPNG